MRLTAFHEVPRSVPATVPWSHGLFDQPWWLETVAPDRWRAVRLVDEHGVVQARLAWVEVHHRSGRWLVQPPLTPALGPWVRPREGKLARRLARTRELHAALIAALPPHVHFRQNFPPGVAEHLAWHWAGFAASLGITYVLDLDDLERRFAELDATVRYEIRRAGERLAVRTGEVEALWRAWCGTYGRQGRRPPVPRAFLARLVRRASERGQGEVLVAVDAAGREHAALLVVWCAERAYYLVGGADPELRRGGATTLLIWRAIERAAARGIRTFDLEGSMHPRIEPLFRRFGGRQEGYLRLRRVGPRWLRAWWALRGRWP